MKIFLNQSNESKKIDLEGNSCCFKVDNNEFTVIFAKDDEDYFTQIPHNGISIKTIYTFETEEDLYSGLEEISDNPDSMWYWIIHNGLTVYMYGACTPEDIEGLKCLFHTY